MHIADNMGSVEVLDGVLVALVGLDAVEGGCAGEVDVDAGVHALLAAHVDLDEVVGAGHDLKRGGEKAL